MDTNSYKQAVTEMYVAMQMVFEANERLKECSQVVWDWDKSLPSSISEASSVRLPASPPSEPEEDDVEEVQPCSCPYDVWKPCLHNCMVCNKKSLTPRVTEHICWMCQEELVTVPKHYPEDAAEAKNNCIYTDGAFRALVLRIRANNCREAEEDCGDDEKEMRHCRQEAVRLDGIATKLLYATASHTFKPWWFERWDYFRAPGYTEVVPTEQTPKPKPINYNHPNWPSPKAKLFANELSPTKIRKHEDALKYLAQRANRTMDELLEMRLEDYVTQHNYGRKPRFMSRW